MSDDNHSASFPRNVEAYELRVGLLVTFDGSPNELTAILGIEPSITRSKGDAVANTAVKHKHSIWELGSGIEPKNSLFDDHISSLEKQLRPIKDKFALLPADVYIELSCYVMSQAEAHYPSIHLSSASLAFFASIGAEVDVDVRYI